MEKRNLPSVGHKVAWGAVVFTVSYILINLILAYLVDLRNINALWLGSLLEALHPESPILWLHMFKEASVTEILQWLCLGFATVLAGALFVHYRRSHGKASPAWGLLLLGLLLMFLEDTVNVRHGLAALFALVVLQTDPYTHAWRASATKNYIELGCYAVLAAVMLSSFWLVIRDKVQNALGKKFLFAGFAFYGIAALSSATRNIGSWYTVVGEKILNFVTRGAVIEWTAESVVHRNYPLSFWIMDFLIEESLELLGATFLLAAVVIFFTHQSQKRPG